MRMVHLYTAESEFVEVANVPDSRRPPPLVEWRGRYFLRHSDGNYYEAECARAAVTEQRLQQDEQIT